MTPQERKNTPVRKYRDSYDLVGQRFGQLTVLSLMPARYLTPNGKKRKLWRCLCDCGKESVVQTNNLCMDRTTSCGCLKWGKEAVHNRAMSHVKPDTGLRETFRSYSTSAKKRGYEFALTIEEALALFSSNCHYCGGEPSNIFKKSYIPFVYSGIDRKDNSIGYTRKNCVPCCCVCNLAKMSLGYDEFIEMVRDIYNHRIKKHD